MGGAAAELRGSGEVMEADPCLPLPAVSSRQTELSSKRQRNREEVCPSFRNRQAIARAK